MAVEALRLCATSAEWTEFHADALATSCPAPDDEAIRMAVLKALNAPIEFPPLADSLTPEDYVAIALGAGMPAKKAVVAGAIEALLQSGIKNDRISVVTTSLQEAELLRELLGIEGVTVEYHDLTDDDSLCFVGLTKNDRKLMLDRSLFDADVLLPITAVRPGESLREGPFGGVFPDFCDQETIARFRRVRSVVTAAAREGDHAAARRREVEEAGWMFGAPLVVSVVPGVQGGVAEVVAGDPNAVDIRVESVCQEVWGTQTPDPKELVIASLGGGAADQTWAAVGRALEAADRLATSGGVIVLWTDLDATVGPVLSKLLDADGLDRVGPRLSEEAGEEALAAWRLMQALERGPVFLKSRLPDETVERLGMAPIASSKELGRLVERHGTCTLLEEAQHVWLDPPAAPTSIEETDE